MVVGALPRLLKKEVVSLFLVVDMCRKYGKDKHFAPCYVEYTL
jgi:hypothetical protein